MSTDPARPAPDQSRILLELALELGTERDVDQLLRRAIERVAALVDAERAMYAVCDDDGTIVRAVVHNLEWAGPGAPLPVSYGVIAEVVKSRRPVVVPDAITDARLRSHESVRRFGLRLVVGVPTTSRAGTCGVLYVDSRTRALRDPERLGARMELLTALARVVGTAVENAQLFEEQRDRNLLLAQLVHDLRAPLTVVIGNAWLVRHRGATLSDPKSLLALIESSGQRMGRMIDATLELLRIDPGGAACASGSVSVEEVARQHAEALEVVLRHRNLTLEVRAAADVPPVPTVRDRLLLVLDNLLFNAIRHADSGTTIRVDVTLRDDAGPEEARLRASSQAALLFRRLRALVPAPGTRFVEVAVSNRGRPIPPDVRASLFRSELAPAPSGVAPSGRGGLGLAIVDQCVRQLGGVAWVGDEEPDGTSCFRFTLPTALAPARPADDDAPADVARPGDAARPADDAGAAAPPRSHGG